jgi:hypothetical protein
MKKLLALTTASVLAGLLLATAHGSSAQTRSEGQALVVSGGTGFLVAPGDRVVVRYTVYSGSKAVRGTLFVRNDLQPKFTALSLERASGYQARVPNRLIRGHRLFYYAVFRDRSTGRSVALPAGASRTPRAAWIVGSPTIIRLGAHRFGQTPPTGQVVARAGANEVGWRDPGPGQGLKAGPQTFLVHRDGSIWLHDEVNDRLLVWPAGQPSAVARTVALPYGSGSSDITFGPGGSLYITRVAGVGLDAHIVLDRLDTSGEKIWENTLGGYYSPDARTFALGVNSPLRVGPDRTLYRLVFMSSDERGWMPVVTPAGKPIPPATQRRGTHWPFQPVAGGLRMVGPEVYTPHDDMAPHELRYALVDRRNRVVRAWRIVSETELNLHQAAPELVGGDPMVVLAFAKADGGAQSWEYEVLRLAPHGIRSRLSLLNRLWGDTAQPDLRIGPDGKLYQLATSPTTGVTITRYPLG